MSSPPSNMPASSQPRPKRRRDQGRSPPSSPTAGPSGFRAGSSPAPSSLPPSTPPASSPMPFSEDEDGDIVADDEEREERARGRMDAADSDDDAGEDLFNDDNLRA